MGKRKKKKQAGPEDPMKRIQMSAPVPDPRPNWPEWDRHEVMMSVTMEHLPENFEREYIAVICPVAKRRIVVSHMGWTCSYNKLLAMDRKFQSSLPGGNVHSMQVMKDNDYCVLDCLHLKAERTFYILDLMHWKYQPHYHSEAEFRFHWINQVTQEMDLVSIHTENEYHFKPLPRFPAQGKVLFPALRDCPFKVDGVLFFHMHGTYTPGTSPSVLWLEPKDIESKLGWAPPQKLLPPPKPSQPKSDSATAEKNSAAATDASNKSAATADANNKSATATASAAAPVAAAGSS